MAAVVVVEINLVFWRGIEIDLVLMWVSKLIFLDRGVEIDFVVVFGPTTFWFSCMDRNLLGFSAGIAIETFFLCGPKMTCFVCGDRLTWLLCR